MHPIDSSLARRSNFVRKGIAYSLQGMRTVRHFAASPSGYKLTPPVIVNSIPKSGTHLLLQVVRAMPMIRYYGSFLAWASSLDLKRRPQAVIDFHLRRIVPGEALGAHLHYSTDTAHTLNKINALHLMIIRDPVDVLLSEAYYLGGMNPFHRMAREFSGLDDARRIELALNGSATYPKLYPPFLERIWPYLDWLRDDNVTIVRYEDLVGTEEAREKCISRIVRAWATHAQPNPELAEQAHKSAKTGIERPAHTISSRAKDNPHREALIHRPEIKALRSQLGYGRF